MIFKPNPKIPLTLTKPSKNYNKWISLSSKPLSLNKTPNLTKSQVKSTALKTNSKDSSKIPRLVNLKMLNSKSLLKLNTNWTNLTKTTEPYQNPSIKFPMTVKLQSHKYKKTVK